MEKKLLFKTAAVKAEPPAKIGHVIVRAGEHDIFRKLVEDSFEIGRGNMQFAPVDGGQILLRIEDPSFYLLRKWREELEEEQLKEFYPAAGESLYVQWGLGLDTYARAVQVETGEIYFLGSDGWWECSGPQWQDIYDAVQVSLPGKKGEKLEPGTEFPRIEIALRLVRSTRMPDAELWRIPESEEWRLEKLLGVMPESDLKNVHVTLQSDAGSGKCFFVRELIAGRTQKYLRFPGTAFASFAGYSNLFLPVGMTFEPAVRADRYRGIFNLNTNEITVIIPESGEQAYRIIRIDAGSFRPLPGLVDYICAQDAEKLEHVVDSTVFDFAPYNYTGPAITREVPGELPSSVPPASLKKIARPRAEREETETHTPYTLRAQEETDPVAPAVDSLLDPLEHEKSKLEKSVTLEPENPSEWLALADVKQRLGETDEAVRCFEEAIWNERDPERERGLLSRFAEFLDSFSPVDTSRVEGRIFSRELDIRKRVLNAVTEAGGPSHITRPGWLEETVRSLRALRLPKKARWLLWREICRLAGDEIGTETARENIRAELNREGLLEKDSFAFISQNLLVEYGVGSAERNIDFTDLLNIIRNALIHIEELDYRALVRSVMAKGFVELGNTESCRKEMHSALEEADRAIEEYSLVTRSSAEWPAERARKARAIVMANAAGILGRLRDPGANEAFERALHAASTLKTSAAAPKEEAVRRLIENVSFSRAHGDYPEIIQGFWKLYGSLHDDRRHIFLRDCSKAICDVGENGTGREKALELLRDTGSHYSLYIRRHGVEALTAFSGEEKLDADTAEKFLDVALNRPGEIDGNSVFYVEGLLKLTPSDGVRFLRGRVPPPEPARAPDAGNLLVNSCIARALSTLGETDGAHKLIAGVIAAARNLDRHRLANVISHAVRSLIEIGRRETSVEILRRLCRELIAGPDVTVAAQILPAVINGLGRLDEPAAAVSEMERVAEHILAELKKNPKLFWFIRETLVACVRGVEKWATEAGERESALALIRRILKLTGEILSGRKEDSLPTIFFHGSVLLSAGEALVILGQDSEAAETFFEALEMMPRMRQMDRDELSAALVESVVQMESRYQLRTLRRLLHLFPRLVGKGLGSPMLKDRVLPRCIEVALLGEPLFKAKLREREGLQELSIRRRLRTDKI